MKNTKIKLSSIFFLITLLSVCYFISGFQHDNLPVDSKLFDAGSIAAWYRTNGSFNRNPTSGNSGFEWPKGSGKFARYASGLWVGAKVNNDTLVAVCTYDYEFLPGYTDNNGMPQGSTDPLYRIYKLVLNDAGYDRAVWPNSLLGNSNQGAPVFFHYPSNSWRAADYGTQTFFFRMTDSYQHMGFGGSTAPLKADVMCVVWGFSSPIELGNAIFMKYKIINRSTNVWNNTYIAIWSDDDLGGATDDKTGCDSSIHLGYTYNGTLDDPVYGPNPPAVGFALMKGVDVFTGNNNDTTIICNGKEKIVKVGRKDLKMTAFNSFINGEDPTSYRGSYRVMQGLDRFGNNIINPITNTVTKYKYSGDPVTSTGWLHGTANDVRFLVSSGPVNMNPGDTQEIVTVQIIDREFGNLGGITKLRVLQQLIYNNYYRNCFASIPIGIINNSQIPLEYKLFQNYPNPFNPVSKIKYQVAKLSDIIIRVNDITGKEVVVLVNQKLNPGIYEAEFDGTKFASGVYFYTMESEGVRLDSKKMVLIK